MAQGADPKLLLNRLARLRRRMRFVVTWRGLCWLFSTVLFSLMTAGLLDWTLHLPALVRGLLLVGLLAGSGVLVYRYLFRPLSAPADDLALALRVERHYPELNDCLGSTIQFIQQDGGSVPNGSASLRQEVIKQTVRRAQRYDFNQVIDRRGLRLAGLAMLAAFGMALPLVLLFPAPAWTALVRLAQPFGNHEWPPQTEIVALSLRDVQRDPPVEHRLTPIRSVSPRQVLAAPPRLARGAAFEVRGTLQGVVPEKVSIAWWFEGAAPVEQSYPVVRDESEASGKFVARVEPGRTLKSFRLQVRAHDTASRWHDIQVLPPPVLAPLDGRPSPQIRLDYPAYTELPAQAQPDGSGNIETVVGTHVSFRAATDRPVTRAWIEYRPDQPLVTLASCLSPLGAAHLSQTLSLSAAGEAVWGQVPVHLDATGKVLSSKFQPWVSGAFALHLRDETDLGSVRQFDLRLLPDPTPTMNLERPSASLDSLAVLPDAEVTLHLSAEDVQYALRSVFAEYRCRKDDSPRRLTYYDHQTVGTALPQLLSGLTGSPLPRPAEPLRLRPQRLQVQQRLSLKQLRHLDGSPLREGDVVTLQGCASDFDNVAVDKEPGRSHEVELRIVNLPTLEAILNQAQAQIQQELVRLREQQRDALKKVDEAEKQWRNTGRLRPEDLDNLMQAEQSQKQIQSRVGTREEGLRAEVARVLQTLQDNHLPRSGTHERMEMAGAELDRLAREELQQIEPLLTNARKENESTDERQRAAQTRERQAQERQRQAQEKERLAQEADKAANPERAQELRKEAEALRGEAAALKKEAAELASTGPRPRDGKNTLQQALQHQEEVEKTINEMLARLEPWSTIREDKGAARTILQEQRRLNDRTDQMGRSVPRGVEPEKLSPEQRADLEKAGEQQNRLADHTRQLLDKMDRVGREKEQQAREKEQLAEEKDRQARQKQTAAQKLNDQARRLQAQDPANAEAAAQQAREMAEEAQALQNEAQALREAAATQQEEARTLQQASREGRGAESADGQMRQAEQEIRANRLGDASKTQKGSIEKMEQVVKALEDRRERELADRIRKMREAEKRLDQLIDEQERLQKKVREAKQLADPQEREKELQRLAREQERLRKETQEMARQLARLRANRAGQAMNRAGGRMEDAGKQMGRSGDPDNEQEDALDRLDDAQRELERARQEMEEELQREQLAKVADQIKRLRERQEALLPESSRIHDLVRQRKQWDRVLFHSLVGLATAQEGLSKEVTQLADGKLAQAEVFAHILHKAAEAMIEAQQLMMQRREAASARMEFDVMAEEKAQEQTVAQQKEALRRLDQLLDALKEQQQRARGGSPEGGNGGQPPGGQGQESDGIPYLAQLKVLRALQAEVNQRTEEFSKQHPDPMKLTPKEKARLETLRQDQAEVAELLDKLTLPAAPEGGKP